MEYTQTLGKQIANSFIREEHSEIGSILTKKSVKDLFIKKKTNQKNIGSSRDSLDDPLI